MKLGYVRCSTILQNRDTQYEGLKNCGIEKYFEDMQSGKDMDNRPHLLELFDYIREYDEIYTWELSRVSRDTKDTLYIDDMLRKKKVKLVCVKDGIVLGGEENPMSEFMTTVMSAVYKLERQKIVERTREGVALAKLAGKYRGRPESKYDIEQLRRYKLQIANKETTKTYVAKKLGISRPTLDKRLKILAEMEAS